MTQVDWRELYASNRAVIEDALQGGHAGAARSSVVSPRRAPGARARGRFPRMPTAASTRPARRHTIVHRPAGVAESVRVPLVCMLHGCTQDSATFAAATRMRETADRHGFAVVFPQQERSANPQACWNWFRTEDQRREGGEPASIAALLRELVDTTAVDSSRVFVAGLSSGGAMAAILAFTHPDLVAAAAIHSGLAFGAAKTIPSALAAMAKGANDAAVAPQAAHAAMGGHARAVPTIVIHGTADRIVAPINARQVLAQSIGCNRLAAPASRALDIDRPSTTVRERASGGRSFSRSRWLDRRGALMHELLLVDGLGHAWSGGLAGGSHSDPSGPDASEAIWRFFADAVPAGAEPARRALGPSAGSH
jgi:poly(hydroxyalkanoate) depolymerase family esterase